MYNKALNKNLNKLAYLLELKNEKTKNLMTMKKNKKIPEKLILKNQNIFNLYFSW